MYAHSNNTAVTIQIVVNKPEMWKDFLNKTKMINVLESVKLSLHAWLLIEYQ